MFENLLFQQHFVKTITHEMSKDALPQSLLFYGEGYSGKLTAAIELSRVLNCQEEGEWQCQCKNCNLSKNMQNPYLLITGSRYFKEEIKQSSDFLLQNRTPASQFVFVRNIRKLIKRFSDELWDKDDSKLKKASVSLTKIEEVLYLIEPGTDLPTEKKLASTVKKIVTECDKLVNELPKGNIPINQIRNISNWVRRSVTGRKKVVVLERAELMQEGSRNSLLKILEEPPEDTYFVLISEKKSTVLPTILSRVRAYGFRSRSEEEQKLILNKLYKVDGEFNTIKEFFNSYSDIDTNSISNSVDIYYRALFNMDSTFSGTLDIKVDNRLFIRFLELLSNKLRGNILSNYTDLSLSQVEKINGAIRDKIVKQTYFNQSPILLLETLFYESKRVVGA